MSSNHEIATAQSLYTQKPDACRRMAWCRPPEMFTARRLAPDAICCAPASDPPTTSADASCIRSNTGLSGVPRPWRRSSPMLGAALTAAR